MGKEVARADGDANAYLGVRTTADPLGGAWVGPADGTTTIKGSGHLEPEDSTPKPLQRPSPEKREPLDEGRCSAWASRPSTLPP